MASWRHCEGHDATGRCGSQRGEIVQPAVVELGSQLVWQAGRFNRKARPVGNSNVRQGENIAPAVPGGQAGKGIGTDQQHQLLLPAQFAAQTLQRMHRIARCIGLDLAGVNAKTRIASGCLAHHV